MPTQHSESAVIRLLPSWLGQPGEVPDPYYDNGSFVRVYRLIEQSVDALFAEVKASLAAETN